MIINEQHLGKNLQIGTVALSAPVLLAPMTGVTDLPFRRLVQRFGAGAVVSEMVACRQLLESEKEASQRLEGADLYPHIVQLAGRDPEELALAARLAEASGAHIIDINMGCPAKRVINGYAGSALMRDLVLAQQLIEAVVAAVCVPVTVKMRLGWDDTTLNAPELAQRAEQAGVVGLTVHARTRCQFYKGRADWAKVQAVREATRLPLIINGDICSVDDAQQALAHSGAQGVMIGRASLGRPWLAGEIARALTGQAALPALSMSEMRALVLEHYQAALAYYGVEQGRRMVRKHLAAYLDVASGAPVMAQQRARIVGDYPPQVVVAHIHEFFDDLEQRRAA